MEPLRQAASAARGYERHRPEATLLYQLVEEHYPGFLAALAARGRTLPGYVQQEFAAYPKSGRLDQGFPRVRCTQCHAERLVAYSCKRRGFCPSSAARRMVETAALLVDEVLPREPLRQRVLSVPFPLRYLFATDPATMGAVLGIVYRASAAHLVKNAGLTQATGKTGAVTLIQRFGSALNLNIHFHLAVLDAVYELGESRRGTTLPADAVSTSEANAERLHLNAVEPSRRTGRPDRRRTGASRNRRARP